MLGGISVLGQLEVFLDKGIMNGLQLGMDGSSVLDLGDCPHTVFILLQLPAERGGGLVQVRNCSVQILDGIQRMGFQIVHSPFDFLKVPDSAFQLCLARPIAALLVAEIEVVHQQVGQRGFICLCLFQSIQKKLLLFVQVCDSALQPTNCAADGLHQAVGGSNVPVQIAEKGFDSALFHLVCSRAEMHGRYLLDALPLKGAQINTFWSASGFQIAVGDGLPAMPPDLGVLLVVLAEQPFAALISGYPIGLIGDDIDDFANIVAIADVYDAMTADRCYRRGICPFEVIATFEREGLGKYKPQFITSFLEHIANTYINNDVMLSNGMTGKIVLINKHRLTRPVVRLEDGKFINLEKRPELYVQTII